MTLPAAAPRAMDEKDSSSGIPHPLQSSPTGRVARLDSLRALACLVVLVAHCSFAVPWIAGPQVIAIVLTVVVFNVQAAVVAFFVMSGWVLGLSLDQGAGQRGNFFRFYVRRVFRIYPAHMVAIGFIAVALFLLGHNMQVPGASPRFTTLFPFLHVSPVDGVLNALLLQPRMNGIVWTLAVEVAAAIVFPLLYLASRHSSVVLRAAVLIGLIGMSVAVGNRMSPGGVPTPLAGDPVIVRILKDLWYLPHILKNLITFAYAFYVGLVAEPIFRRLVPRIEGRSGTLLLVFGLALTVFARIASAGDRPHSLLFLEVAGATILVFCGALMQTRNAFVRALDHPFLRRLGAISYSFYLYHLIVLYCIGTVMFRVLDPTLVSAYPLPFVLSLMLLAFLVTKAIASLSYRLIELPMIGYSKRLTRRRTVQPVAGSNLAVPTGVQA